MKDLFKDYHHKINKIYNHYQWLHKDHKQDLHNKKNNINKRKELLWDNKKLLIIML